MSSAAAGAKAAGGGPPFEVLLELSNLANGPTTGSVKLQINPNWSPLGAKQFRSLVSDGFYDEARFFRVVPNFGERASAPQHMLSFQVVAPPPLHVNANSPPAPAPLAVVQFGINADPAVQKLHKTPINDDPTGVKSNMRGTVTFATSGLNTRTTQLFINTKNNPPLDGMGFTPFGEVIEGMDVVDHIYDKAREKPNQGKIQNRGNEYLNAEFPELSYIVSAKILA
jgi:cyclophilin family peptidyl-prolyl cis-trans isomerase